MSAPFNRILCGVDPGRASWEAARQAAFLSATGAELTLLSVYHEQGQGLTAEATITKAHAEEALARAIHTAETIDVEVASVECIDDRHAREAVVDRAKEFDLLVVGQPPATRIEGITLERVSTFAIHVSPTPVMIARRPPEADFPGRILVGLDGSDGSRRAGELAGRVARAFGAPLVAVAVTRGGVAEDVERIATEIGAELIVERTRAGAREALITVSSSEQAALLVLGSRGLTGIRALGSVSERVAHEAPCSVLVAR